MRHSFAVTWILLVLGIACSSSNTGSDTGKVPATPEGPASLPDPMNGQTGSPGACECSNTEQCSAPLAEVVTSLKQPGHHNWHFVGSTCVARNTNDEHRCCFAHPTGCRSPTFGDGDDYVPENDLILGNKLLCDMEGRSNDCLYGCKDFPGCDPAVATSCDAVCADMGHRIEQDEAKTFDAEVRSSTCTTTGTCRCRVFVASAIVATRASRLRRRSTIALSVTPPSSPTPTRRPTCQAQQRSSNARSQRAQLV